MQPMIYWEHKVVNVYILITKELTDKNRGILNKTASVLSVVYRQMFTVLLCYVNICMNMLS